MNTGATTVDASEVEKFSAIAAEWWNPKGKFGVLHKFNPVRLTYIREKLCEHFSRDPKAPDALVGLRVLDIGCGGGLLSEPLARMGATVVGADAGETNIEVAKILAPSGPATGAGAIDAVTQIRSDIGIDKSISDLGGDDDLLPVLIEDAMADPVNMSNPRPVDPAAFEAMYRAAW